MALPLIAAAVGGGILNGVTSMIGQSSANKANAELAQRQMQFQERMSNTAYQRSKADMEAAGINPALMYGSGGPASSPGGASATMQNIVPENAASSILSSALDTKRLKKDIEVAETQKNLNDQMAFTGAANAKAALNTAAKTRLEADIIDENMPAAKQEAANRLKQAQIDSYFQKFDNSAQRVKSGIEAATSFKNLNLKPRPNEKERIIYHHMPGGMQGERVK